MIKKRNQRDMKFERKKYHRTKNKKTHLRIRKKRKNLYVVLPVEQEDMFRGIVLINRKDLNVLTVTGLAINQQNVHPKARIGRRTSGWWTEKIKIQPTRKLQYEVKR